MLHALSAGIGSVVDRMLVLAQEQDADRGATWLETNSAGSGPFRLLSWQANEAVVLAANPNYRHGAPGVQRVILRHVPEPSAQRLLLERGDIDLARDLTPDLIAALAGSSEIAVDSHPRGTVIYLAANAGHPILGKEQVVQALRHAVDYHGMANTFLAGQFIVHQAFWPRGLWAGYTETPYRLDVARARSRCSCRRATATGSRFASTRSPARRSRRSRSAVRATLADAGIEAHVATWEGRGALAPLPGARARADPGAVVARLRRPALQRRRLRPQPGQPRGMRT